MVRISKHERKKLPLSFIVIYHSIFLDLYIPSFDISTGVRGADAVPTSHSIGRLNLIDISNNYLPRFDQPPSKLVFPIYGP